MSIVAFPALLGVHAAAAPSLPPGTLVAGGALHSPATLLRAQVSSRATAIAADGATLALFAADTPRFTGAARRLVVEGQRTNDIAAPLAFDIGWTALTGGTGSAPILTPNYGLIAAPDGSFTATRLQLSRGAGATATDQSGLTRSTATSASRFVWIRTLSGTANVQIGTNATTAGLQSSVDTTWRRLGVTGGGGTHRINLNGAAGNSASADLLVWGASTEGAAPFLSSLVLPPVGQSQTSTRGADLVTAPLAALGVGGNGACTLLWSGRIPVLAAGTSQHILQIDDGTNSLRWALESAAAGPNIRIFGTGSTTPTAGTHIAGTPFRAGVAINGAGRAAASVNGAAAVAAAIGPSAGLTTLRLGTNAIGGVAMFGETTMLRVLPAVLSDTELASQVAALPV